MESIQNTNCSGSKVVTILGRVALVAAALCAASAQAAQNCISNGDFELPVANYNHGTGYSYTSESGNGGKPTGWTLSPNNRFWSSTASDSSWTASKVLPMEK